MNDARHREQEEGRPVVLTPKQRRRLTAIAASLERRNLKIDADLVRSIGESWDGADGFVVVHRAALVGLPDPEGEPA